MIWSVRDNSGHTPQIYTHTRGSLLQDIPRSRQTNTYSLHTHHPGSNPVWISPQINGLILLIADRSWQRGLYVNGEPGLLGTPTTVKSYNQAANTTQPDQWQYNLQSCLTSLPSYHQ